MCIHAAIIIIRESESFPFFFYFIFFFWAFYILHSSSCPTSSRIGLTGLFISLVLSLHDRPFRFSAFFIINLLSFFVSPLRFLSIKQSRRTPCLNITSFLDLYEDFIFLNFPPFSVYPFLIPTSVTLTIISIYNLFLNPKHLKKL